MVTDSRPSEPKFSDRDSAEEEAARKSAPEAPPDPWAPLAKYLRELHEYIGYYLSVRADQVRLRVLKGVVALVLAVMAGLTGAAIVASAGVLLLVGIGQGLGELFGGRLWLGNLVTGATFLAVVGLSAVLVGRRIVKSSQRKTVQKYAQRNERQLREFGRDISGESR